MKKLLFCLCIVLWGSPSVHAQTARAITNPQVFMIGARQASLGSTVPTMKGDLNSLFINPASVANVEAIPISLTTQKVIGVFDYQLLNAAWPFEIPLPYNGQFIQQKVAIGLSYGYNALNSIPETIFEDNRIRQVGTYSAGFDIIQLSAGSEWFDIYGIDTLSGGISFKNLRQFIADESRSAIGADVGVIGTVYYNKDNIDKIHFGASILNVLSTGLVWDDNQQEAFIPLQVFAGLQVDMFDESLSLFAQNDVKGLSVGAEYLLQETIYVRGSTNMSDVGAGVGLKFENLASGISEQDYSLRIDYSYTHHTDPTELDPNFALSISILGASRPKAPRILYPNKKLVTAEKQVTLSGVGPKDTSVQIYNNNSLARTAYTDRFGNWSFKNFPLREGTNNVHLRAYSIDKDASIDSDLVVITSDTTPPTFSVQIYPEGIDKLAISVASNEPLRQIDSGLDGEGLAFSAVSGNKWIAKIAMPSAMKNQAPPSDKLKNLQLFAVDTVGNQTKVENFPFFASVSFPTDKTVHYKDSIRFLGKSSPQVLGMDVDGSPIYVDPEQNFSLSKPLKLGKNLLTLRLRTANNTDITHTLRILRLKTFPDLTRDIKERREIEFLATLEVLDGDDDGKFYPNRDVTRRYLTRMMVKVLKLATTKPTYDLFRDVPKTDPDAAYIQAAIENGLAFAFPDGSFKPDQPLTLSEALFLLSNARIVDAQPELDEDQYIKRRELAQYLAYSPRYELQIERLIDWERGYTK
jgi:hypothetical protein